jgi:hypothetical protein
MRESLTRASRGRISGHLKSASVSLDPAVPSSYRMLRYLGGTSKPLAFVHAGFLLAVNQFFLGCLASDSNRDALCLLF